MNCFTSSLAVAACVLSEVLYPKPLKGLKEQSVWKVPFRGFRGVRITEDMWISYLSFLRNFTH